MTAPRLHPNSGIAEQPKALSRRVVPSVKTIFTEFLEVTDQYYFLLSICSGSEMYSQVFQSRQSGRAVVVDVLIQGHSFIMMPNSRLHKQPLACVHGKGSHGKEYKYRNPGTLRLNNFLPHSVILQSFKLLTPNLSSHK